MDVTLILTEQEANTLGRAIDVSIKTEGVGAAIALVPIFQKLQAAVKASKDAQAAAPFHGERGAE